MIFVDSSAFLAVIKVDDANHSLAKKQWRNLLHAGEILFTNNYIVVESLAILQKRSGVSTVQNLQRNFLSLVQVDWVEEEQHDQALKTVLELNRRRLSLVDCTAFQTMRRLRIETAFTFDSHFREEGFKIIP